MKLSTNQLQSISSITSEREANQTALNAVLSFYISRETELASAEKALWQELAEIHGLDLTAARYEIQNIEGVIQIVELAEVTDNA